VSELGAGTTVEIYLPISDRGAEEAARAPSPNGSRDVDAPPPRARRGDTRLNEGV